ncbi:hypothetical protein KSS93_18005 [Pseudomonas xanthosomatis]|uniref:hypothetical protein n=1 Tax=Pseudomonas xanthosomatis TaxID=2842356 RepID=UPI001C3C2F12|nr:hypothetical protein [Pseudomonas xanthosomatis]QXH44773.1 hypothetical protein KSS93_18005 [Pseudomonas xanthosomatis]
MNKTPIKILKLSPDDENEATLEIGGFPIRCFISHCPNVINEGEQHLVELTMYLEDDYKVVESPKRDPFIRNINNGFSVEIAGYLNSNTLRSITTLDDEGIHYDYPELNDKFVIIYADRLQVDFD